MIDQKKCIELKANVIAAFCKMREKNNKYLNKKTTPKQNNTYKFH